MILKINETAKDSILTPNSNNINYPVTNIVDSRRTRLFRTVAATTTAEIVFDAGAAINVTSVVIDNHNISSGVTTLKLQGNATDAWGGPSVDETLVWSAGIIKKDITQASYRYWRIQIIDAGNTDTFIELGRVWIGDQFATPYISPTVGHSRNSNSVKTQSQSGQSYMDSRYFNSSISVRWPYVSHAEKANLITQFEISDIGIPFYVTFDETEIELDTLYVTIDQDSLNFNLLINPNYYESAVSLLEEV